MACLEVMVLVVADKASRYFVMVMGEQDERGSKSKNGPVPKGGIRELRAVAFGV
jgi:hypothetical protein